MQSRIKASIEFSPLLRTPETNLAEEIISTGLNTGNVSDWMQQMLGIPSFLQTNALTMSHIQASINATEAPKGVDQVRIAGIDQGRGQHWIYLLKFDLPFGWREMPSYEVVRKSYQTVLLARDCLVTEIPDLLNDHYIDFGLIDNEPEIAQSAEIASRTVLQLADQKPAQLDDLRKIQVKQGGITYDCWGVNHDVFLRMVLNSFLETGDDGYPLQRIPKDWDIWLNNPSELSPIRHLLAPKYDPDTRKWIRGEGNVDDLYYACMFAQAAFLVWLTHIRTQSDYQPGLGNTVIRRDRYRL